MIYVEWLRARKRLAIFAGVLTILTLTAILFGYFGLMHSSGKGDVSVGITFGNGHTDEMRSMLTRDAIRESLQKSVVPFSDLVSIGALFAMIFTLTLYTSLHAQRTSLDVAFTKPLSRARLATAFYAIDFATIVACDVFVILLTLLALSLFGGIERIAVDGISWLVFALGLGSCVLLYGLVQLATASFRGAAIGIVTALWIGFVVLVSVKHTHVVAVDALFAALRRLDPLYYFGFILNVAPNDQVVHLALPALAAWVLGCIACACAIVAWQRVEV